MDDPNNWNDVRDAFARIARKHQIMITPEVEEDLRAFGLDLPPIGRRGRPKPGEASFVVAGFYDLLKPKALDDNIIGRCGSCGRWIQYRPHMPAMLTKLCLFCASYLD